MKISRLSSILILSLTTHYSTLFAQTQSGLEERILTKANRLAKMIEMKISQLNSAELEDLNRELTLSSRKIRDILDGKVSSSHVSNDTPIHTTPSHTPPVSTTPPSMTPSATLSDSILYCTFSEGKVQDVGSRGWHLVEELSNHRQTVAASLQNFGNFQSSARDCINALTQASLTSTQINRAKSRTCQCTWSDSKNAPPYLDRGWHMVYEVRLMTSNLSKAPYLMSSKDYGNFHSSKSSCERDLVQNQLMCL